MEALEVDGNNVRPFRAEGFDLRALAQEREARQQNLLLLARAYDQGREGNMVWETFLAVVKRPFLWAVVLGLTAFVVICILASLASLDPLEYGMAYSSLTKQIDESHVYRGGRHLIGPFSTFLKFPATVQSIEFSLSQNATAAPLNTRSADGLALTLHVSFQYHLEQNGIPKLYHLTNVNYEALYVKLARESLLLSASKYKAELYWMERKEIGEKMSQVLNEKFTESYARCAGLQFLRIDLPEQFEHKITGTQVSKQIVRTKRNEQQAALVRAQIGVMIAKYQQIATVTINKAKAESTLTKQKAEAQAAQMRIDAEAQAFRHVQDELGLDDEALVIYQRNFALHGIDKAHFFFGVENPMAVIGSNGATQAKEHREAPPQLHQPAWHQQSYS